MQKKFHRVLFGIAVLGMLFTLIGPVQPMAAATRTFPDLKGHWAAGEINNWNSLGLVGGYPDGTFGPSRLMTKAEFITYVNRAFGYTKTTDINFADVKTTDWFAGDVTMAIAMGYTQGNGNGTFQPNQPISRLEAARILYKVLRLEPVTQDYLAKYTDIGSLSAADKPMVNAIVAGGYFGGYPDKTLRIDSTISRAEMIVVLARGAGEIMNVASTFGPETGTQTVNGNATINKTGITLRNTTIKGDLYITEGVGDGDFYLKNVNVLGRTIVAGGGSHSGHVEGTSQLAHLIFTYPDGTTRVVMLDGGLVGDVEFRSSGILDMSATTPAGSLPSAIINEELPAGSTVLIIGQFAGITVNAPGVTLQLGEGSSAESVTASESAIGSTLDIQGDVTGSVTTNAANTTTTIGSTGSASNVMSSETATGSSVTIQGNVTQLQSNAQITVSVTGGGSLQTVQLQAGAAGTDITKSQGVAIPKVTAPSDVAWSKNWQDQTVDTTPPSGDGDIDDTVLVSAITVTGTGNVTTVVNGSTLQMSAAVAPTDATNQTIAWSVTAGTGTAIINATGLLTATEVGTVTVTAKNAASGVTGTKMITVTENAADLLSTAKTTAHGILTTALGTYTEADYTGANWTTLNGFKTAGDTAIDAATTLANVTTAQNTATDGMAGVQRIFTYTTTANLVTITGYTGADTVITIPSTLGENPVTIIGNNAFLSKTTLTSITIPNSVTNVGNYAFNGCTGLTSVTIGSSVTSIGACAFQGCRGLTSVTIPSSVKSIAAGAFYGCTGLNSVTMGGTDTTIDFGLMDILNNLFKTAYKAGGAGNYTGTLTGAWTKYVPVISITGAPTSATVGTEVDLTVATTVIPVDATNKTIVWTVKNAGTTGVATEDLAATGKFTPATAGTLVLTATITNGATASTNYTQDVTITVGALFTYTTTGSEVTITGYTGADTVITIPSTLGGNPVTIIGNNAFLSKTTLTSITIPNSVTSIGDYAFHNCIGLTSVTIPSSVTSIGDYAFQDCTGLTSVTIPDSVTSVGDYAFHACTELTSVTIGSSVTSIGDYAFQDCAELTSITIPNSVTSIGICAFQDCAELTSVTIPSSVTSIGICAFQGCRGLTSVTIPSSVTSIGDYAFDGCTGLTNVTMGKTGTTIGDDLMAADNDEFKTAYNASVAGGAGNYTGTSTGAWTKYIPVISITGAPTSATVGTEVDLTVATTVNPVDATNKTIIWSFYSGDATGVTNADLEDGKFTPATAGTLVLTATITNGLTTSTNYTQHVTITVGALPFTYTTTGSAVTITGYTGADTVITIPSTLGGNPVTIIGDNAFEWKTKLTSVTIPNSVTNVGNYAFIGCTGLTSVTIGSSVTSIGLAAFSSSGLTEITIPDSVTSVGDSAFQGCIGLTSVTIGSSVTSVGDYAFYLCTELTSVTIGSSVTSVGDYAFYLCTKLTSVTIGSSVTSVGDYAFSGCTGLTSVTIPSSVTSIGDYAFQDCTGLTSVSIPDSVTSVGDYAFHGCTELTSVTIGSSVTSIGLHAFSGCAKLTSITIPNSVTSIGVCAFQGCTGLASVTIPSSVTSIGDYAFRDCTGLTSVTMGKTGTTIGDNLMANSNSLFKTAYNAGTGGAGTYIGMHDGEWGRILFDSTTGTITNYYNTDVVNVVIPSSIGGVTVTEISSDAFNLCTKLNSIEVPNTFGTIAFQAPVGFVRIDGADDVWVKPEK